MIDRQLLPLALLYANNEQEIQGRTRLQKLVFLIQKEFKDNRLPGKYNYIPYDYGPFAKKLYEDLDYLKDRGFIKESKKTIEDDKVKYNYTLTPEGRAHLEQQPDQKIDRVLQLAETIKSDFNDLSLPELLDYVYTKYPDYAENSVL